MNRTTPKKAREGARQADRMRAERQAAEAARVEADRVARVEADGVARDQRDERLWNAPRAEGKEAQEEQDLVWADMKSRRDLEKKLQEGRRHADRTREERRAAADAAAASETEKTRAVDSLRRRAGKMTRLFEKFENEESNPVTSKLDMQELASKWGEFRNGRINFTTRNDVNMNKETMLRIAQQFRSSALVISDASQSGKNLRDNLIHKRDTHELLSNGEEGMWGYYLQCRLDLIGNLSDLAAYYERRANTGEDVFIRRPDRDAAPRRPLDVPDTVPEDHTAGNQACEDVCGQIVHQIMSNLEC